MDDEWPIDPEVYALMRRCQIGDGNVDRANDILADCYGTLGMLTKRIAELEAERDAARVENEALRANLEREEAECLELTEALASIGKQLIEAERERDALRAELEKRED